MTSDRLARDLRNFAEKLGATLISRTPAGQHHKLTFTTSDGRPFVIPIPKGTISESGRIIRHLQKQIERAAR